MLRPHRRRANRVRREICGLGMTLGFALLVACSDGHELPGDPGNETGPCVEGQCLPGLVCLSNLCVDPAADSTTGDGGSGAAASGGNETSSASGADTTASDTTATSTTSPSTSDETSSASGGRLPNGAECGDDGECESGRCYVVGVLGGVCGECKTDADCTDGGCRPPNVLATPAQPAMCEHGEYGDACMSDAACDSGLTCTEVWNVPNTLTVSGCSECASDAGCSGQLCAPELNVLDLSGAWRCVTPGSLADGDSCDFQGSGDSSCNSNHCAIADFMGLFQVGVCSECETSADCGGGFCIPPEVDLATGLVAGACR